ncbi:hypothetical protein PAXINDRAFT_81724, partial [Paxillus involutus ATCC 200175]
HDQYVKVIAFSRSGRLIATRCNDNKVYLWEAPASEDPKTTVLEGHENTVLCICFCAENIVSGSVDHTLRIWDQKTGATQVLIGHTDTVDVSQDGKTRGHRDEVYSVKFSPDLSGRIVSGSEYNTIRVWSLAFEPIECHSGVECVRYSPGGDRITSGTGTVQIWNAKTVPVQVLEGHENTVLCICFCAENIVSGSVDHTLRIWDQKTGATQVLIGHTDTVYSVKFSPDLSGRIVSGSEYNTIWVWSV